MWEAWKKLLASLLTMLPFEEYTNWWKNSLCLSLLSATLSNKYRRKCVWKEETENSQDVTDCILQSFELSIIDKYRQKANKGFLGSMISDDGVRSLRGNMNRLLINHFRDDKMLLKMYAIWLYSPMSISWLLNVTKWTL